MLTNPLSVLVVEDDVQVRKIISGLLSEAGFTVATAATGLTALKIIGKKPVDLVVADIALPGDLSGMELMQCARLAHPLLRCLFVSGQIEVTADDPDRDEFVGKPFRRSELLGCVWELLQRKIPTPHPGWEQRRRQAERILVAARLASRQRSARSRRLRPLRTRPGAARRIRAQSA